MPNGRPSFVEHLETLFKTGAMGELTDRQLLERFTACDQETADVAFSVLIKRHGPMVFETCRAILRDEHESEDAVQATFLVLARKARGLWVRNSLGPWLFEVARRVAAAARIATIRRRAHERKAAECAEQITFDANRDDLGTLVWEEVGRLPKKYRTVVVLCDLERLTQAQAAHQLGWPPGTVRSRLARARDRLRVRLTRRGLGPGASSPGAWSADKPASTLLPALLEEATVLAALRIAGGRGLAQRADSSAVALMEGLLRTMFWNKLKLIATVMLTGSMITGTVLLGHRAMGIPQAAAPDDGKKRSTTAGKPEADLDFAAFSGRESLSPALKARIEVAKELRDNMFRLWQEGELRLAEYLAWQRRYEDVVAEAVTNDRARVQFLERRVSGTRQLEKMVAELYQKGQVSKVETLMVKLERLEAEDALGKAKLKLQH
jgi:RNA polymerase sigma factor (sigma-70 family)